MPKRTYLATKLLHSCILEHIKAGKATVSELRTELGCNRTTVVHHLRAMEELGLIKERGLKVVGRGSHAIVYCEAT